MAASDAKKKTDTKPASLDAGPSVQELRDRLKSAEQLAMAGELASTVTHEFNNVLMTILNYAQLGLRHKDAATRDKALQKIHDSATRAAKICATVLSVTRSGDNEAATTDLASIIRDTLVLLERELQKYRIYVEQQLADVPKVSIGASQIQRVLINLLTNARQAIGERGTITIALSYSAEDSQVLLSVRDTGSGIKPEVLPKIFEQFFSTKTGPDSSGKGGTGLGLSSCREIIEQAGGRIRVASGIGKGTIFTIRLPIAQAIKQSA